MKKILILFTEYLLGFFVWIYTISINIKRKSKKRSKSDQLLIMKFDELGDFVMFLDFAKGIKEHYPNKEIILFCESDFNGIVQDTGYFDKVIIANKNIHHSFIFFRKLLIQLKTINIDIAIQSSSTRSFFKDLIFRSINAKNKYLIGTDSCRSSKFKLWISNNWYDSIIPPTKPYLMEKQRNADFMHKLGFQTYKSALSILPDYKNEFYMDDNKSYVLVCPCAVNPKGKEWAVEKFAKIIKFLNKCKFKVVISGTAEERERKKQLFEMLNDNEYIDLMGKTNIKQFISIVQQAVFVIGNDSSCIHIAAASNVKSICLLSGFNSTRAFPYIIENSSNIKFVPHTIYKFLPCTDCINKNQKQYIRCDNTYKTFPCIDTITVEDVKNEITTIIEEMNNFSKIGEVNDT